MGSILAMVGLQKHTVMFLYTCELIHDMFVYKYLVNIFELKKYIKLLFYIYKKFSHKK